MPTTTSIPTTKKPYLHEVDLMRLFFICGVLFNHTINVFTDAMTSNTDLPYYTVRSIRMMFHYTRMGFLFMSGLVLMMNYYNRHDWPTFFKKRYKGSIWPYLIWNFILLAIATLDSATTLDISKFSLQYLSYVIHGNQSYMYFMLIVMQLYLLFPAIVWLFKRWPNHHNRILAISFATQLVLMITIKYYLQGLDTSNWLYWFKNYSINVFSYQFYFIAGAYMSLHHVEVYQLIKRHIKAIATVTLSLSLGTIVYYRIWNEKVLGLNTDLATTPHQPYMFIYDTMMIVLVFWLGKQYASWREHGMPAWLDHLVQRCAKVSFGMYLNQIIGLTTLAAILSHLTLADWQLALLIPVGYGFVLVYSFALAWFCYKVAPFGILVGRPQKRPRTRIAPVTTVQETKSN